MARQCHARMISEGVDVERWRDLSADERVYYPLILENMIANEGWNIFNCKKQWAARLLLQEHMKSQRQNKR